MKDRILLTFALSEFLFLVCGGLILVFSLVEKSERNKAPTLDNVATNILLSMCPLTAGVVNAVFVFVTFLVSIPALIMPMNRGWLVMHGYMVVFCGLFSLILGLSIWFETLKTRSNLSTMWDKQPVTTQSLLQESLACCGFFNSTSPPFVIDSTCPNAAFAATMRGCVTPFTTKANNYLDLVFTGLFGIVGVDFAVVLAAAMLFKDRKEKERYRHIDEKSGVGAF
ncbi:hypothetical protein F5884DRAFT_854845 [Xylogone sp. PMI_703]|nr:hypothetical protein F5884DRAFT_854845 [Xylogone sp. PMI_703]